MLQSPLHPDNIRDFGDLRTQAPLTPKLSRADELRRQIKSQRNLMYRFFLAGCRYQALQQFRSVMYLEALLQKETQ